MTTTSTAPQSTGTDTVTDTGTSTVIDTVLIANRGEIACRIIDTLRKAAVRTVAVYSDADAHARHVREADIAIHIGPAAAAESYLSIENIIHAAKATGAQAIHPGYGFLSENAEFSQACQDAGIIFMGPSAAAISTMGDKISARHAVESRDVPTVPGISRPDLSDDDILSAAGDIEFPVLIKPSAGGGGKGMHRVEDPADLPEALITARREAQSSFGDDSLFVEHFVDTPRHIEVQILADSHGNVIHLGERECSLQRRHQKVVEEAPSPLLDEATRERIGQAACDAARSVGYVGAGTVEFIVSAKRPELFFFMEMNTRLQVEHPVTEEVTGLDLVSLQLEIARGYPLPLTQDEVHLRGHSVEVRIYAEDPAHGFLPTGGTITAVTEASGPGVRVDSGIDVGDEITSLYDPMIMKVITHGHDRQQALQRMDRALAHTLVAGFAVNTNFGRFLVTHPEVVAGRLDTGLLERIADDFTEPTTADEVLAAAGMIWVATRWPATPETAGPWEIPDAWRPGRQASQRVRLAVGEDSLLVSVTGSPTSAQVIVGDQPAGLIDADGQDTVETRQPRTFDASAVQVSDGHEQAWRIALDGQSQAYTSRLYTHDGERYLMLSSLEGTWQLHLLRPARSVADEAEDEGLLASPMPGTVIAHAVEPGSQVEAGDAVLVVEAMKMEHTLRAPHAGIVSFHCDIGEQVPADTALATIETDIDTDNTDNTNNKE